MFPVSVFRLHHLESKVIEDMGKTPDIVCELKSQVESFKRKLEVCHADAAQTQLTATVYSPYKQKDVNTAAAAALECVHDHKQSAQER